MKNTVRQAAFYDTNWGQENEQYLFKDLDFSDHLQTIHWHLLFNHHLSDLQGRRVLDIGCGTGWTSMLLAKRGALVTAVDISPRQIALLRSNATHHHLEDHISALAGDITKMGLPAESFDLCLGAAFLHHLEHEEEEMILREIARLLHPGGTAFFVEPAVNSRLLDRLRYLVPVPGRPARWSRGWDDYRSHDPHPERDNSSAHFRCVGQEMFDEVEVEAMGICTRLERLTGYRGKALMHRWDYVATRFLPRFVREPLCRVQIIRYRKAGRVR